MKLPAPRFSAPGSLRGVLSALKFSPLGSLACIGALALVATAPAAPAPIELNGIAAKVNGKVITKKEVGFHMAPIVGVLRAKYPRRGEAYEADFLKAKNSVLERLIENKIVLSELERRGAAIPDHVIDGEVKRIIGEMFNGNEKAFRESLAETGMNMQGFRESQKEKILIQAFRSQQFADVPPSTSEEISAHYKKRRKDLRDRSLDKISYQKIFILAIDPDLPVSTPELQLVFAEEIAKELRDGADFEEKAKEYSAGAFAADGGLWEDKERIDLSPAFAEVIFESEPDKIIGPLKDPAGFTIVKVIKKSYGPSPPLSEVRDRMRQEVEIEKRSVRYRKWIAVLMRSAMIERRI